MYKKNQKGFTIIEVLIVLAIAGLIMLIVFLAVPALQRNSRNTKRTNDISRIGGAIQEWSNNNNGKVLTAGEKNANLLAVLDSAGDLGYYQLTSSATAINTSVFSIATGTQTVLADTAASGSGTTAVPATKAVDKVRIVTGAKCNTATMGATTSDSARKVAIQFATETNSGSSARCQDM